MAGEIAEAIVSSVLVELAERGVVEDLLDEFVDAQAVVENHHSDMNELRGVFADDADAEELSVSASEDELEHASGIAGNMATRVVGIKCAANDVVQFLL